MTRSTLLAISLSTALASGAALAATQAGGAGAPASPHGMRLDANGDGVIDRSEAAASPRLQSRFDALDANRDGRLSADELRQARGQRGNRHGGHRGDAGIARLDANGDGRISRAEAAADPRLAGDFAQIDGNRDGDITRGELRAWRERQRPQREAERNQRFDERFAAADLNHDGKLSKLEVSEKMPRLQKSFAWMDENRDGFLSKTELRSGHH